jgi:hypothetical protein
MNEKFHGNQFSKSLQKRSRKPFGANTKQSQSQTKPVSKALAAFPKVAGPSTAKRTLAVSSRVKSKSLISISPLIPAFQRQRKPDYSP